MVVVTSGNDISLMIEPRMIWSSVSLINQKGRSFLLRIRRTGVEMQLIEYPDTDRR